MKSIRDAFGEALVQAGEKDSRVVVVSCDLKVATRTKPFFDRFPERSFEVGIAEANGIGIAAGLGLTGYKPFISSFAAFLTGKNVEIRTSIAYNNAPVVMVGTHGGLIGPDGATQSGLQDIAVMRTLPGVQVFQPCSARETHAIVDWLLTVDRPVYFRVARNAVPEVYDADYRFIPGKAYILKKGKSDFCIFASGPTVHSALEASKILDHFSPTVVSVPSIKPLDASLVRSLAMDARAVFTVEDHDIAGGLGSAICEVVSESGIGTPVYRLGIDDQFILSGSPQELETHFELDPNGIAQNILRRLENIKRGAYTPPRDSVSNNLI